MTTQAHILAIDDEPGMRTAIERALRGYTVRVPSLDETLSLDIRTAGSAEEGLERIAERRPDLVLLDHKLPGMSGLDLLDRLDARNDDFDLLVIVITAYASIDTAVKATKHGAYDFLAKPFTPLELKSAVRNAICHQVVRRRARALAEERRQVRFQFISVLAHELKAPIGAVEGFLELMGSGHAGDDPKVQKQLIDRSLVRLRGMRKLIYDLLDLTRIEAGTKKRELSDIDIVDVVRSSIETVSPDALEKQIEIVLEAPSALVARADRGEMEIIFNNLVSNAVKYNKPGGHVDVRISEDGGKISIEVADTGIGMSEQEAARLFSDFVRIKNAKTRGILGSGLGLSIVKKLAELNGGGVSVTSTPDVGSTFRVVLDPNASAARSAEPESEGDMATLGAGE